MTEMSAKPAPAPQASLFWPTIATIGMLAALIGLGTWQLQRKAWKDALIETIRQRATSAPIGLDAALARAQKEDLEYAPVTARGRFLTAKAMLYYAPDAKLGPGYHLYVPLVTEKGPVVIVNRGFVAERELKEVAERELNAVKIRPEATSAEPSEVTGLLRKGEAPGRFTPANEAKRNLWYWRDLAGMSEIARDAAGGSAIAPFFLETVKEAGPVAAGTGRGGATRLELPNRHLEYALTWYGLAAALIAVYLFYCRNRKAANRGL